MENVNYNVVDMWVCLYISRRLGFSYITNLVLFFIILYLKVKIIVVLEFRYTLGLEIDSRIHKIHNIKMSLTKKEVWTKNQYQALLNGQIFDTSKYLTGIQYLSVNLGSFLPDEILSGLPDLNLDFIVIFSQPEDSPKIWSREDILTGKPTEESVWIDLDNYMIYRNIVASMKFDPMNNTNDIMINQIDLLIRPYLRDIKINKILK